MKQVLLTLALVVSVLILWQRALGNASGAPSASPPAAPLPAAEVVISMLYSPGKQAWIEWARDQYVRENPSVQVKLTAMESVESIEAILNGHQQPVVWSPASLLELGDVAARWPKQTGRSLYASDPRFAPQSLLRTVLVLVAWESRAHVLDEYLRQHDGDQPRLWKRLIEASASPAGWAALDGPAEWGAVKVGYTDPLRTSTGLWALYLACLDELDGAHELPLSTFDDPNVVELLRSAASSLLSSESSAQEVITRMEQFGPSRYDLAVTSETLALAALKTPKERWERLVIYYPPRLVWMDHPAVVLDLDGFSDAQKEAGLGWIQFLRSHAAQLEAIRYGFRPADASVLASDGAATDNPFVAVPRRARARLENETALPPPEGAVVDKLLATVRDAFARLD